MNPGKLKKITLVHFLSLILIGLIFTFFNYLFTIGNEDKEYLNQLDGYRVDKTSAFQFKIYENSSKKEIEQRILRQDFDSTTFAQSSLPSKIWKDLDQKNSTYVLYRFKLFSPNDNLLWAFAPINIAHTQFWAYAEGVEIFAMEQWENDKYPIIFPLPRIQTQKKSFYVYILAALNKEAYGLQPTFGYYYGPYKKFPRISYHFFNLTFFPKVIYVIGILLTIIMLLLVLWVPSHQNYYMLVLYSLFYNVLALYPILNPNLESGHLRLLIVAIFQSVGLGSLGMFYCDYFKFGSKRLFLIPVGLILVLFPAIQFSHSIADHYLAFLRILFTASILVFGSIEVFKNEDFSSSELLNRKLFLILIFLLFVFDLGESYLFFDLFYERYHALHIIFFAGVIAVSIQSFRQKEFRIQSLGKIEAQLTTARRSFKVLKHDIFDPINRLSAISLMIQKCKTPEQREKFLVKFEDVLNGLETERKYVEGLISDMDSTIELAPAKITLCETSRLFCEENLNLFGGKFKQLTFEFELGVEKIRIDEYQLLRVLRNLVKNAVKATNGNTAIKIGVKKLGKRVEIFCHNTNSRIPEEILDKIFNPFVSTSKNNMGLGLFICETLVSKMGGTIKAQNMRSGVQFSILVKAGGE